jgi:hypothetical protein
LSFFKSSGLPSRACFRVSGAFSETVSAASTFASGLALDTGAGSLAFSAAFSTLSAVLAAAFFGASFFGASAFFSAGASAVASALAAKAAFTLATASSAGVGTPS